MRWLLIVFLLFSYDSGFAQLPVPALLHQLQNADSDSTTVVIYRRLAKHYAIVNLDSSLYYCREGLAYTQKHNYRLGEAYMRSEMSATFQKHNIFQPALDHGLAAQEIFREVGYPIGVAAEYNGLGIVSAKRSNYPQAQEYFLKALKIFEEEQFTPGLVQTYIKLAMVQERIGNLDRALEYYLKGEELNRTLAPNNAYFTLLNGLGIIHAKQGHLTESLAYFRKGAAESDTPRYADVHLMLLSSLGNALHLLERNAEAIAVQKRVLRKTREIHLFNEEARALTNLANLYRKDTPGLSIQYLKEAIDLANRIESQEQAAEAWILMADIKEQIGDYEGANLALKSHHRLADSMMNADKAAEIAALQATYDLEKSEARVKNLTLTNQKHTLERNILISIAFSFLILAFVLWIYYRYTRRLNARLGEANEVKDKLFSIIGHDLKGPMNAQLQLLELIEAGVLSPEEEKEMLAELKANGEVTLETLNSLLQWGKSQIKGIHLNRQVFATKPIISKNIEALQTQAGQKNIRIVDNTNGLKVDADADHFNFTVRNLLSNAIKFSHPNSQIEVGATERKTNEVVFSVKDSGLGIGEEQMKNLFKTNTGLMEGTYGEKGTGLGLMLCKDFIKANGGNIWVSSKKGEGTTFYFSLKKA